MNAEVHFNFSSLVGKCKGNVLDNQAACNITGASILSPSNIVIDEWNVVGGAVNVNKLEPYWHGRVLTFKADAATVTFRHNTSNILNRSGADISMEVNTTRSFIYYGDTGRWHQL